MGWSQKAKMRGIDICLIKENQIGVSNITYRGKPLQNKISKMMEVYREGKSTFNDLLY